MTEEKHFLTLDAQCKHLIINKKIIINSQNQATDILLNNNYFNIISCSKIKFAKSINQNKNHIYNQTNFNEWTDFFDDDCKLSEHLMTCLIRMERKLNSRTAFYISELLESKNLPERDSRRLIRKIQGHSNYSNYDGKRTWEHITKKTFNELRNILKWLWNNNQRKVIRKIINDFKFLHSNFLERLDELVNLRNSIFHFKPLSIYLVHGNSGSDFSQYNVRKKVVEIVFYQNNCDSTKTVMVDIFRATKNFIGIKSA